MQRLNAIDAITPAMNHTQRLLGGPRNWRVWLKIGAVAFFAQMGGCSSSFNVPRGHHQGLPPAFAAVLVAIGVVIAVIALILGLAFFYLSSRLQFVLFDMVLRRDTRVAPIWRRYDRATWYWMGLKVLFFLAVLLFLAPVLVPTILHFIHSMPDGPALPRERMPELLGAMFGFLGAIFLVILFIGLLYALLADFGLPSMALEGTSLADTLRRIVWLVRAEPGQVLVYLILRFLLSFAAAIGCYIALAVFALVLAIPFGGCGFALWMALRHAGTGGQFVLIAGSVVLIAAILVPLVVAAILLFGVSSTFLRAYSLFFLGGRYPLLGSILEPDPGSPFTPPPPFPSPDERSDDGGPPFPMDPVIA
ncbi:hypothetical protein SAMN05421770_10427 [Granulicella rosea]|uniref:Uncharacterized protein n=1 Tax=Granulicella rosea TaxID=474952 RepID=A0A239JM72_9BACT|nr:hypothetical protein [Granulicella rosea]SNT06920.1 hypothetical protein SAMN05421770_10427 [Granulicella rosea]